MEKKVFHHKYVFSPPFYWWSLIRTVVVLSIVFVCLIYFPSPEEQFNITVLSLIFAGILLGVAISLFNKRVVNYLIINYNDRTIEVNYIVPFRECNYKTTFDRFVYAYYVRYYDFWPRLYHDQVLRMNFNNDLKLSISELELTYPKETMDEIVAEFETLGLQKVGRYDFW